MDGGFIITNGRVESDNRDGAQMAEPFQWNLPEDLWAPGEPTRHELPFAGVPWDDAKSYDDIPNDFLMMCRQNSPGPLTTTFRITKVDLVPLSTTKSKTWVLNAVQEPSTSLQDMLNGLVIKYDKFSNILVKPVGGFQETKLSESPWLSFVEFDTTVPIEYESLEKIIKKNPVLLPLWNTAINVRDRNLKYLRICNATSSFFNPQDPSDQNEVKAVKQESTSSYVAQIKFTEDFMYLDFIQLQNLWDVNFTSENAYKDLRVLIAGRDEDLPGAPRKLVSITDALKKLCVLLKPAPSVATAGLQLADSAVGINWIGLPTIDFKTSAAVQKLVTYKGASNFGLVKNRDDVKWNRQYVHLTLLHIMTKREPLYVKYMNAKKVYRKTDKKDNLRGKDVTEPIFSLIEAVRTSKLKIVDLKGGTLFGASSKDEYNAIREVFDSTYTILIAYTEELQQLGSGENTAKKLLQWPPQMDIQDAISVLYAVAFPANVLSAKENDDAPFSASLQATILNMFDARLLPYMESVGKFYKLAEVAWAPFWAFRTKTKAIGKLFNDILRKQTPHGDNHDNLVFSSMLRDSNCAYSPPQGYSITTGSPEHVSFNDFLANILRFYVYKLAPGKGAPTTWKPNYTGPYTSDLYTEYKNSNDLTAEEKDLFSKNGSKWNDLFKINSADKHAQYYYRYIFKDINPYCENLLWSTDDNDANKFSTPIDNVRILDLQTIDNLLLQIGTSKIGKVMQDIRDQAPVEQEAPVIEEQQIPDSSADTEREDEQGLISVLDMMSPSFASPAETSVPSPVEFVEEPPEQRVEEPPQAEQAPQAPEGDTFEQPAEQEEIFPEAPVAAPKTTALLLIANRNSAPIVAVRAPRTSQILV